MDKRVWTVDGFCSAHELTRGMFYKLKAQGKAPETIKLGRKTLITEEAASQWLRSLSGNAEKATPGAA